MATAFRNGGTSLPSLPLGNDRCVESERPFRVPAKITASTPGPNKHESEPCPPLPALRFKIPEASAILRMSRAQLYNRISAGTIKVQKDGARTYITRAELERYIQSCN